MARGTRSRHAKRARIDIFLLHYLTIKRQDEVSVAHLYASFREYVKAQPQSSAEPQLQSLRRYAQVYRGFDEPRGNSTEELFFERLAAMDVSTAYPFLLDLFVTNDLPAEKTRQVLQDLESFLVRRMVCRLSTRGYNRLFIDLLSALHEGEGKICERVRNWLLSSQSENARWPNDAEFRTALLEQPIYQVHKQRRVRMLLEAVEREMRTGKSEQIEFKEKLQVEHLMPQESGRHWPLPRPTRAAS